MPRFQFFSCHPMLTLTCAAVWMDHTLPCRYNARSQTRDPLSRRSHSGAWPGKGAPVPLMPVAMGGEMKVPPPQYAPASASAAPQSDLLATAELMSWMTELCSFVVRRLDAGLDTPPQAQASLSLNIPVTTLSGYTEGKCTAGFLDNLTTYQTGKRVTDETLIQRNLLVALV